MARKTHISILQFDERCIARLRARRSLKGIDVAGYDVERGSWSLTDGSLADALKAFVKTHRLAEDEIHTVLPRHEMTARILSLPSHSALEIESMVRLSAEEYVPYPAHELVIDQCVLQKLGDGTSSVLAVFAHKDVVESHVELLRKAGVEPAHIYVSTACLASAVHAARPEDDHFALVNLAPSGIEIIITRNGRLAYGRGVRAGADWSDDERNGADEVASELRATLSAYRRESEDGEGVDRIYVCSDYADCAAAAKALSEASGYDCAPAKFASALFAHGTIPGSGIPMVSAGAALAAQGQAALEISLIPGSLLQARKASGLRRTAMGLGGMAAAVLIAAFGLFAQAYYQRLSYSRELQNRIAAVQEIAESVQTKRTQLTRLQQHLDRRGSALELLAKLSELVPRSGVTIQRLTFSHNESLTLQCRAESTGLAFEFADALRSAGRSGDVPQFVRAQSGDTRAETEQDQQIVQFEITIPLAEEEESTATAPDEP